MKEVIRGDKEPCHLVAADRAINEHKRRYGSGNKYHPVFYSIGYRGRYFQIEVVTRKSTIAATVITGVRNLTKVYEVAA